MATLPALLPLRHPVFRSLWLANVVTALGTWMQNTGAGWLMTSLSPNALSVSLIQAATITPPCCWPCPPGRRPTCWTAAGSSSPRRPRRWPRRPFWPG